jgi:hypothetical protein
MPLAVDLASWWRICLCPGLLPSLLHGGADPSGISEQRDPMAVDGLGGPVRGFLGSFVGFVFFTRLTMAGSKPLR